MTKTKNSFWYDIMAIRKAGRLEEADDLEILYNAWFVEFVNEDIKDMLIEWFRKKYRYFPSL